MSDIDIKVTYKDINDAIVAMGSLGDKVVSTALKVKREVDAVNKLTKLEMTYLEAAKERLLENKRAAEAAAAAKKKAAQDTIAARKQQAAIEKQLNQDIKQELAMNARFEKDLATQSLKVQRDRARDYTTFWENHFDEVERMQKADLARQDARDKALADQKRYLDDLTRSYNPLIAAAERYSDEVTRIQYALANGRIDEKQATTLTGNAASKRDVTVFGSGFDSKNLERDFNTAAAAARLYEKEKQRIIVATQRSILSTDQEAAALDKLEAEYRNFANGVSMAGSRFNQFEVGAGMAANGAAKVGFYAQQAGYQIGDFAVQLQSGANAGVAFSQQAAQLAGLIPGIAGALTTFAAIGVGLAIQAFTRMKKEVGEAEENFKDLGSTLDQLETIRFDNFNKSLLDGAKAARSEYGAILDMMEAVETRALRSQLNAPADQIRSAVTEWEKDSDMSRRLGGDYTDINVFGLEDINQIVQAYGILSQLTGETREELVEQYKAIQWQLTGSGLMTTELQEQLTTLGEQLGIHDLIKETTEDHAGLLESVRGVLADQYTATRDLNSLYKEQYDSLYNTLELMQYQQVYGEDSLEVHELIKQQKIEAFAIELRASGLDEDRIKILTDMLGVQIDIEREMNKQVDIAGDLNTILKEITGIDLAGVFSRAQGAANTLLGTVSSFFDRFSELSSIGFSIAGLEAETAALESGSTPDEARLAADLARFRVENPTKDYDSYEKYRTEQFEAEQRRQALIDAYNEANKPSRGGSSGGGGSKKTERDPWADMVEELRFKESLIGLNERQRNIAEEVMAVEKSLGDDRKKYTDERIQQMALQRVVVEELIEAENERIQQIESTSDALANVFTSALRQMTDDLFEGGENIKDIFNQMTADIIEQLYQDMVVKDFAQTTSNFIAGFFSANGSAFNSNGLRMFAAGGVVDSPTKFAYNGGIGMAGEAGPEAILPLKRGAGGKLGVAVDGNTSGGGVVVTQHFHIAANGDEAVRQIIRQEAPAIAERTKSAIMNDKMRGRQGL